MAQELQSKPNHRTSPPSTPSSLRRSLLYQIIHPHRGAHHNPPRHRRHPRPPRPHPPHPRQESICLCTWNVVLLGLDIWAMLEFLFDGYHADGPPILRAYERPMITALWLLIAVLCWRFVLMSWECVDCCVTTSRGGGDRGRRARREAMHLRLPKG
ncbi:hypothetical protein BCR34DRAFT_561823 [Clohesyomyces aquaticus]|uniref:Uncharacterized protein n=1 Tax=Clohesyomyces aquaticus TaxID=1231657 RepID=A0A1Y1ZTR4_9PLEO|nr:hypothetical protein BCR34DRAFT_561823 [Clohesyomyces aquaticus]